MKAKANLVRLPGLGILTLVAAMAVAVAPREADAGFIAYVVPAGQSGNQQHTGALGMDFVVGAAPIQVTQLGVFDDDSNGLARTLTAYVWDRTNTAAPLATLSFTSGDPGTLVGGSRFKTLASPLVLPAGFQGTISADGYGSGEDNGNSATPPWTTNTGGGLISFVGTARYHASAGVFPSTVDGGPANRYAAGTFEFDVAGPDKWLTWDATVSNWGAAPTHWTNTPPDYPNADVAARVNAGQVTVEANYTAYSLEQGGGTVIVGAGNTLSLPHGISSTAGTVALQDASTLQLLSEGGTIANLSVSGNARLDIGPGTVAVTNLTMASNLNKAGAGTLTVQNVNAPGSTLEVSGGTLRALDTANYVGWADLVLSGGTFEALGVAGSITAGLREGRIGANFDVTTPNPGTTNTLGVRLGQTNDRNIWGAAPVTWVYTGQFYDADGVVSFAESIDDNVQIVIDGVQRLYNTAWNVTTTTGIMNLGAGPYGDNWHNIEIRLGDGGGGCGAVAQNGWTTTFGFGHAINGSTSNQGTAYVAPQDPGNASFFRTATYGAINMATTDVTVAAWTAGSRINAATDVGANFGRLTFGTSSDLTLSIASAGASYNFAGGIVTAGDASLGLSANVNIPSFDDQGIPGTFRMYGTKTLTLTAATPADASAKATNFQVDTGATFRVAGAGLLGGDPLVTLNGGTFTVAPTPAGASAYMQETHVSVIANSTINAATTGIVALGQLGFDAPSILATTGQGTLDFMETVVRAAGTSGINAAVRTIGHSLDANGLAVTFAKQGASDLIFTRGGAGLGSTTLNVQAGTLALIGSETAIGAAIRMSGGNVVLGSSDGADQTFANAITSTASGTITAGSLGGYGATAGDITLASLAPGAGTTVTLAAQDAHRILLPNGVASAGSLRVSQGQVLSGSALSVANLDLTGGTTTTAGNVTATGAFTGANSTLATEGNLALTVQGSVAYTGTVRVNSGSLTATVPTGTLGNLRLAGGTTLSLAGAGTPTVASIGTTTGPVATGSMVLSAGSSLQANAAGDTLTANSTINATNFSVAGPGTVALTQSLSLASGGTLSVAQNATLASQGAVSVGVGSATVTNKGLLSVDSGTLTMTVQDLVTRPAGSLVSGAAFRFDATDIDGNSVPDSLADGTAIATWVNKGTAAGVNAGQGTAARQPSVLNDVMNGNAAVSFSRGALAGATGIEDYLEINNGAMGTVLNNPHTIFVVARTDNGGADDGATYNNNQALVLSPGNHNEIRFTGGVTSGATGAYAEQWYGANAGTISSSGSYTQGTAVVLDSVITGSSTAGPSSIQLFINGAAQALATNADRINNSNPNILRFGAGNIGGNWSWYLNGYIGEVLLYPSALSATDRQAVENYLLNKWTPSYAALGDVNLAAGTTLTLNAQSGGSGNATVGISALTAGTGATIQGNVVLDGPVTIGASPGTLNVAGSFTMASGSTYHWEHDGTNKDLVDVTGSVAFGAWTLGITLAQTLPPEGVPIEIISHTMGSTPSLGTWSIAKENSYAQLINSATITADGAGVYVTLDLMDNTTWTSNTPGAIVWHSAGNWSAGVPTAASAALVQAPTATQIATILPGATGQAQTLIIESNGHVQVNGGGALQVGSGVYVENTGTLTLDYGSALTVPLVQVNAGGTLAGPAWPPSRRATLDAATTVQLAGGTMAGNFTLTKLSTTAGTYALEVESGLGTGTVYGPAASLRKTTAGAATFSGEVTLNNIRVEAGSLTFAHGPALTANNITVTGGTLQSNKNTTVGTLDLQGGTTTLTRATTVTTALRGSATLIADGSFDLDVSSANVNFTGTLRVANTYPPTSGNLTVVLPTALVPNPGVFTGLVARYSFDDAANLGKDYSTSGYTATNSGASYSPLGHTGGAASFPGVNEYLQLPSNATLDNLQNLPAYTLAAWIRADQVPPGTGDQNNANYGIIEKAGWHSGLRYSNASKFADDAWRVGDVNVTATSAGTYASQEWHHVAVTVNKATGSIQLYVDGVPDGTASFTPGTDARAYGTTQWRIGTANPGAGTYRWPMDGLIDDAALWSVALTPQLIQDLYQSGFGSVPQLGNLRLDPHTQVTLSGGGVAGFTTIGATGGLTISTNLSVQQTASGPANIRGTATGVHLNADVTTTNFTVTGPGTVSLGNDAALNIASGGKLNIPAGVTLSGNPGVGGTATVNAATASIDFQGGLNVASGTLVLNLPAGGKPQGAAAYYSFDNVAGTTVVNEGSLGTSKNGTLAGGATIVAGRRGNGMNVNDDSAMRMTVGAEASGQGVDIGSEWTVSAWFYNLHPVGSWRTLIRGAQNDHQVIVQDTAVNLGCYDNANGGFRDSGADLLAGQGWHHIVAVGNAGSTTTSFYIDGVLVGTSDRKSTTEFSAFGNHLGGGQPFAQIVDEFVVYNRALSAAQLQDLYNAGLNGGVYATRMGDLTMSPGTRLVSTTAPVGFSTATIGGGTTANPTTMTGDFTIDRRIAVTGTGRLLVNGPTGSDGDLRISDGLVYEWSFRNRTSHDLIEVLGDLHFGGSFTLSIFGEGSSIQSTDWMPIFLYSGILDAPPGGLDYTIQIGNAADPRHLYIWDTTDAALFVGLHEGQQGIWLHGLVAQAVPEPGTLSVLALGALALLRRRRRGGRK